MTMATIKEKAKEYAKMKHTDKNLIDIVSWDFEAGANYVLEVVETILEDKDLDVEETYDKIYATIKQLKE